MHTMIVQTERQLPAEWSDDALWLLVRHARDLGHNGNPGGYMLTVQLFPFVGEEIAVEGREEPLRALKDFSDWDFDGMRQWIKDHEPEVLVTWRRELKTVY